MRTSETFDWIVIGGGIHGTYVARELLEAGVPAESLAIVDSYGTLCESFRQKARTCGMETLRSNYVQHVGPSPFGLEQFASARDRENELVPTRNSQPRPTLDLFLDYTEHVIDRFDIGDAVREATVTGLDREDGRIAVETTTDLLRAQRVVLAVGPGERFRRPEWAGNRDRIEHVWDEYALPTDRIESGERVWVVGGGTTAGQFATAIADHAQSVDLCTRRPLEVALREADPVWLNWKRISQEIHTLPPGSRARYERIREARNDGTVPPYLERELDAARNVTVRHDNIRTVADTDDGLLVSCRSGQCMRVDRIFLATGFEPVFDHPFVGALAASLSLARGHRGMPMLDDQTLRWETTAGKESAVAVTGKLAEGSVGPFAGNLPGARRAAERIVPDRPSQSPQRAGAVSD